MDKKKSTLAVILTIAITFVINVSMVTLAYFVQNQYRQSWNEMEVNIIFGRLDNPPDPDAPWGTEGNPFLISEEYHLINLYTLQNRTDKRVIDENSVFQVSTEKGKPVYIGGINYQSLMPIYSIGTEEFPFVSTLRGVKATNTSDYVELPNGENGETIYSDTSVLGNIQVNATPNQFDIGIFGNVGPKTKPTGDTTIGNISNLVLYNVEINATSVGTPDPASDHKHFVTTGPASAYETNHIGLLIGHAQYAKVSDISVYYSSTGNRDQHVKAFRVNAGTSAKYTTAQGVIGYYTDLIINDNESLPLSSTGFVDQLGEANIGLGLGVVYSDDIWHFMEKNVFSGVPQTGESYGIKKNFGAELYGGNMPGKKAFNVGVFTFAHSKETQGEDRLEKIWPVEGEEKWVVSPNETYDQVPEKQGVAKKYTLKNITSADMESVGTGTNGYHRIKNNGIDYNNQNNFRYMFTTTVPDPIAGQPNRTKEMALVRYGASVILKEIVPNDFVILEEDLPYYTFQSLDTRTPNPNYPPYTSGSSYRYHNTANIRVQGSNSTTQAPPAHKQFAGYGQDVLDGSGPTYKEGIRPLRVFYLNNSTPSVTFNASSSTSIEGLSYRPYNSSRNAAIATSAAPVATGNNSYDTFLLRRTNQEGGSVQNIYMTYTEAGGLSAAQANGVTAVPANVAPVKLYTVQTSGAVNPSGAPVTTDYNKIISTPLGGYEEIDMSTNVLMYTGSRTTNNPTLRYQYDLQTIEDLNWSDNNNKPLTKIDTALTMGDATSYYYVSGATNPFWGVAQNLPSPISATDKINVPEGSIGFTVSGTGKTNTFAKVFVLVSSNPKLGVNQEITISRFGTGSSQTADRNTVGGFVLPPVPERDVSKTVPIQVTTNGTNAKAYYPNLNRLTVGYEFSVSTRYNTTYFLEASQGIASFVYLSAERTAATDNNPTHENKINFPHLTEIDYVIKGTHNGRTELFTVTHPEYDSSLASLYFGLKPNPANPNGDLAGIDPVLVSIATGLNFTYQLGRTYNTTDSKYYLYITINVQGYSSSITKDDLIEIMNNYQFEFSEWSYVDLDNFEYAFTDVISMQINGQTISNWTTDLIA